jgi:hypothetical protein
MAAVKFPLLTGFCGGLVIFAGSAYLGGRTAEIVTYRLREPTLFKSLREQNSGQLRDDLLTLRSLGFSKMSEDTPLALQKNADYLEAIRNRNRPELRSVLDLQIATNYVEMARLEQDAGDPIMADRHRQKAENILRSLGWRDVSGATVAALTHGQRWWKATK